MVFPMTVQIPAVPRGGAGDRRYCTVWKIPDSRDAWKRKKRFRPVSGSPGPSGIQGHQAGAEGGGKPAS